MYWIWLSLACTPGSTTFKKLLGHTDSAYEIYKLDSSRLAAIITSRSKDYPTLCDKSLEKANEIYNFCVSKNIGIVTYGDREFPSILKQIPTPPVLLYYRGKLPDFDREFAISVVGTRMLSDYGRKNAFMISYDLARAGAIIVSGMAIGIDGVAHAGAIAAGKPTVAVIGSGIDVLYPKIHGTLARKIVNCGCVLTE
ncbi:MAG: DNA-processing protein DprA, partial [Clostridia bacterium]|nr:DNA-processing protein DprA [Clostridia bacterium]